MRIITLLSSALITLAATTASAADFVTLNGVTATPMASSELEAVKGTHFHFFTESNNELFGETGLHLVNIQIGNGGAPTPNADPSPIPDDPDFDIIGKGYRGLCVTSLTAVGPC